MFPSIGGEDLARHADIFPSGFLRLIDRFLEPAAQYIVSLADTALNEQYRYNKNDSTKGIVELTDLLDGQITLEINYQMITKVGDETIHSAEIPRV